MKVNLGALFEILAFFMCAYAALHILGVPLVDVARSIITLCGRIF